MKLTREQADFYVENGYLKYGKILSDELVDLLRAEYDAEFERARTDLGYRNLSVSGSEQGKPQDESGTQMLQIINMGDRNIHFRKVAYNTEILDIVQDLIGPNIMLFHDQALFKPAHHGGAVYWHQDNAYWRNTPPNLVSCWMTLDDATVDNGAMQVIPGSHLRPVWHEGAGDTDSLLDVSSKIDTSKAVPVELPAGGCMFHHCQTLHYTQPNTTDRQRRAFILHFMPPGTLDLNGNPMRVDFSRPMLRALV